MWALERWEQAGGVLPLYTRDASFDSQGRDRVHRQLRERGDEVVAGEVGDVLGGG